MIAHVVGAAAQWPLWITGTLLFGGAVAAMAVPLRWRRACLAVAGVGLVATVATYLVAPAAPPAPGGVTLRIGQPAPGAAVTTPLVVRACAAAMPVPGAGRLLSVSIDGRQVAEVAADTAIVDIAPGAHRLHVELVTADHRAFAPPLAAEESVVVVGNRAPTATGSCQP